MSEPVADDTVLEQALACMRVLPHFLSRVLAVTPDSAEIPMLLARQGMLAAIWQPDSALGASLARNGLPVVTELDSLRAAAAGSDAVLLAYSGHGADLPGAVLETVLPELHRFGLVAVFCNDASGALPAVAPRLTQFGFQSYAVLGQTPAQLILFVPGGYNPIEHARALLDARRAMNAYELLVTIPDAYLANPETNAAIQTETLLALLAWLKQGDIPDDLLLLSRALQAFYQAVASAPRFPAAYQCMAEIFRALGGAREARNLLDSIEAAAPSEEVARQRLSILIPSESPAEFIPPVHEVERFRPRTLFILPPRMHYGVDVLFHGLCRVLGEDCVTGYPWKPSLHGIADERLKHYPCVFQHAQPRHALEDILDGLRDGAYDLVLWGDCESFLPEPEARAIADAANGLPLFIVDAMDECVDVSQQVLARLGLWHVDGYFKREMLRFRTYAENIFPLPFAYPDGLVPVAPARERDFPLFWAGHRQFGLRRLFLEHLESALGIDFTGNFDQQEYTRRLGRAQIGLDLAGAGFDTVRYWEVPAHGASLLAEQRPIHIPHNFVHGESAYFFENLADLEVQCRHLLANPEESSAIATAGHQHLRRHHTASARAGHLLGWVASVLSRGG